MASASKQIKSDETENVKSVEPQFEDSTPFTVEGKCDDEVTLLFDDGQKLYVSRNFLCYASPVFSSMFTLDFKEKQTGIVELKDKTYNDVLEFLLILHPLEDKYVTETNLYQMLNLAEEYQVTKCIQNCKRKLMQIKRKELQILLDDKEPEMGRINAAGVCLKILSTAALYGYTELEDQMFTNLARIGSNVYTMMYKKDKGHGFTSAFSASIVTDEVEKHIEAREKVLAIFMALPAEKKVQLLNKRLRNTDDNIVLI